MLHKVSDRLTENRDSQHQAFVERLPNLQDLAAHSASADHSMSENGAGSGEAFRDGMEADERECECHTD